MNPSAPRLQPTVELLAAPVPLWPGSECQIQVVGVMSDADEAVRNWWLALGRTAAKESDAPA